MLHQIKQNIVKVTGTNVPLGTKTWSMWIPHQFPCFFLVHPLKSQTCRSNPGNLKQLPISPGILKGTNQHFLVVGWTNPASQIGSWNPRDRGEKKQYLKPPPGCDEWINKINIPKASKKQLHSLENSQALMYGSTTCLMNKNLSVTQPMGNNYQHTVSSLPQWICSVTMEKTVICDSSWCFSTKNLYN